MEIKSLREKVVSNIWFSLLTIFFAILWLSGGASQPTAPGQAIVRGAAVSLLILAFLFARRPPLSLAKPVLALLLASILLVLLQLVPLPIKLWSMLPGRIGLSSVIPENPAYRPLSMAPSATINAAASLLVPGATLVLSLASGQIGRLRNASLLLGLIAASTLVGALQFLGLHIDNPFINDPLVDVTGTFANRNHFALFLALGCLLAPVWAFLPAHPTPGRSAITLLLLPLFIVVALASGSRAGLVLCCLGLALGLLLVRSRLREFMKGKPTWMLPALISGGLVAGVGLVVTSIASDRAVAINRSLATEIDADIRVRALPTVISMTKDYFPVGAGFGTFDPVFRIKEPFALLKLTYFNHAHNDFLEIILDGGLPALLLLLVALGWWLVASARVLRQPISPDILLGQLGSAILLLIFLASIIDYPARTPIIMAVVVLAALWLSGGGAPARAALPRGNRHL